MIPLAQPKSKLLRRLWRAFSGLPRCRIVKLRDAFRLVNDSVRIPYEGFPIQILLGDDGKRLQLYPEYPLQNGSEPLGVPSFLLEDPDHSADNIRGFVRLEPGEQLTLGRDDAEQQELFRYPPTVAPRHLRLFHDGDAVVFSDLTPAGTCISPLLNEEKGKRLARLQRVREIFGGPLAPLPKEEALALIREVIEVMEQEAYRPRDERGLPGGLLQLPEDLAPILLADMHARIDNLLVILSQNGYLEALERGDACLVVLGDAVHSERDGELDRMESSLLMMDLIFRLKLRFPERFFYIRGNHDGFSEDIAKGGIPQGLLWKRALKEIRGKEYRKSMTRYYEMLPYVVTSPRFAAVHAAPSRTKISADMLVNIQRYPGLVPELISNRMVRPNRPGGYTKGDIKRFRKTLELQPETPVIVGHTPLDRENTYWLDVGGAANHHILYSAGETWVGAFAAIGDSLWPLRYPCEPLLDLVNSLPEPDRGTGESRETA
jgi:hypothetical protein